MAESIICPVCGEANPGDMEFCRNCQSRLRPLTGALKGESGPIQPGEAPTKKVTSELEPLLPQWLRDARRQARDSAAEDAERAEQAAKEPPTPSAPDLLDGLASQRDDEDDEVPDWLAQITGAKSKKKKQASDDNQVKWVELGRERGQSPLDPLAGGGAETPAPAPRPSEGDELSDWFKQAASSAETADFPVSGQPAESTPPSGSAEPVPPDAERPAEDLNWLTSLDAGSAIPPEATGKTAPLPRSEVPDWLRKLEADQQPPPAEPPARTAPLPPADVPGWLSQLEQTGSPAEPSEQPDIPDWLSGLPPAGGEPQPPQAESPLEEPIIPAELPDWLSPSPSQQGTQPPAPPEPSAAQSDFSSDVPDWLSSLPSQQETQQPAEPEPGPNEPLISSDMPDWLSSLPSQTESQEPPKVEPTREEPATPTGLPDWISSLRPQQDESEPAQPEPASGEAAFPTDTADWLSSLPSQEEASPSPQEQAVPNESLFSTELPDWLSAIPAQQDSSLPAESPALTGETITPGELPDWISQLGAAQADSVESPEAVQADPPPEQAEAPAPEMPASGAALTPGELGGEDVDSVFASMQTPEWLSAVLPVSEPPDAEKPPEAAQEAEEPIGPAELPSWVQAMRPVESAMAPVGAEEDAGTEKRGPLAGLSGVLPSVPGAADPSSKPKSYSIKLNASEQQLAHAALLERILAAETAPIPMRLGGALPAQRVLRWLISALLLLALGAVVLGGSQMFALPSGVPNETVAAISAIEAIPADAAVLLVFDYQPSTVGEMEAAGGPLLDHLLLLNPPRLAILSTSPTGSALAERFMTRVLSTRGRLVPDQQYVNLGYLPGGLAGIYSFAQSPAAAMPLDAQRRPAWQSSVLAPVQNLSDFAAIIVLTDSVESGRSWIEQTAASRGNSSLVLVASAQAGPMLLPYVDSGQVNGMVSGIYGAVGAEQRNAGSPACVGGYDYLAGSAGVDAANGPSCVRRYWDAYSAGLYLALALITLGALWNLGLGIRERRAQGMG
jgi:hypothetical protein